MWTSMHMNTLEVTISHVALGTIGLVLAQKGHEPFAGNAMSYLLRSAISDLLQSAISDLL